MCGEGEGEEEGRHAVGSTPEAKRERTFRSNVNVATRSRIRRFTRARSIFVYKHLLCYTLFYRPEPAIPPSLPPFRARNGNSIRENVLNPITFFAPIPRFFLSGLPWPIALFPPLMFSDRPGTARNTDAMGRWRDISEDRSRNLFL